MLAKTLPSSSPSYLGDSQSGNPARPCLRGAGIELNCFPQKQFPSYGAEFPQPKIHYLFLDSRPPECWRKNLITEADVRRLMLLVDLRVKTGERQPPW
jgi:hypothetical protein